MENIQPCYAITARLCATASFPKCMPAGIWTQTLRHGIEPAKVTFRDAELLKVGHNMAILVTYDTFVTMVDSQTELM